MKIGILTFHLTNNYGAELQAYALLTTLKDINNSTEFINYVNEKMHEEYRSTFHFEKYSLRHLAAFFAYLPFKLARRNKFKRFNKNHLNINGKIIHTTEEIKKASEKYDKIVVGSDQVFNYNITGDDYNFYLEFLDDNNKKVAYAPSFGVSKIDEDKKKKVGDLLSEFECLSVREVQGQQIIKNLTERDVPLVTDPTYLLSKEQWLKICQKPKIKEDYILFYHFGSDTIQKFADDLSEKTGLPVYELNFEFNQIKKKNRKSLWVSGPCEFVGMFANAKYVVTNSFHGVAFSIIFNKEFYLELRQGDFSNANSRLISITNRLGLTDRIINEKSLELNEIDYTKINKKLDKWVNESKEYLKNAMRG